MSFHISTIASSAERCARLALGMLVIVLTVPWTGPWAGPLLANKGPFTCEPSYSRPYYKTRQHYCLAGQKVPDAYSPGRMISCEEMEVDHLISLREAWVNGVCNDNLKRLANDPRNLRITHWRTNRAKGITPPEVFSETLPPNVREKVRSDAAALRLEYNLVPRDKAAHRRMTSLALNGTSRVLLDKNAIPSKTKKQLTYRKARGKTVVYFGKRALGYVVIGGLVYEAVSVSTWAAILIMTPNQDERMKQRAETIRAAFDAAAGATE